MRYKFTVSHLPGKDLIIANTLSRASITAAPESDQILQKEADCFVDVVVESLAVTERQLERIKLHQREDETCQLIVSYWQTGWPEKHQLPAAVYPYHSVASEISVQQGLLCEEAGSSFHFHSAKKYLERSMPDIKVLLSVKKEPGHQSGGQECTKIPPASSQICTPSSIISLNLQR